MPCAMPYWKAVMIVLDQAFNAVFLRGWPDETLSSRAWRWHISGKRHWPRRLIDALFWFDRDKKTGQRHCQLSFVSEREGRQLPPEARSRNWKQEADVASGKPPKSKKPEG